MRESERAPQSVLPVRAAGQFLVVACGPTSLALPAGIVQGILRPQEIENANSSAGARAAGASLTVTLANATYRIGALAGLFQRGPVRPSEGAPMPPDPALAPAEPDTRFQREGALLPPPSGTSDQRIILCGGQGRHRGVVVDQVQGLMEVEAQHVRPLPPHFRRDERKWFAGFFLFQTTVALVVDPEWLLTQEAPVEVSTDTLPPEADGPIPAGARAAAGAASDAPEPRARPGAAGASLPAGACAAAGPPDPPQAELAGESVSELVEGIELEEADNAEDIPWANL